MLLPYLQYAFLQRFHIVPDLCIVTDDNHFLGGGWVLKHCKTISLGMYWNIPKPLSLCATTSWHLSKATLSWNLSIATPCWHLSDATPSWHPGRFDATLNTFALPAGRASLKRRLTITYYLFSSNYYYYY